MLRIQFNVKDKIEIYGGKQVKFKKDNFDKILSLYAECTISNGVTQYGYTRIHSNKLKKCYSGYKRYIDHMIVNGQMERCNYKPGVESYGYRLTELFKEQLSIEKIAFYPDKSKAKSKKGLDIHINVDEWVKKRLKSDFYNCTINFNLNNQQLEKTKDDWGGYLDLKKWFSNNKNLYLWTEKKPYFKWKSGRLYNNFTSLSSHIRGKNILLNGESIVEFDISNSFPLVLAKYCTLVNPNIINEYDFKQYCFSVLNGSFYTELQYKLNEIRNCCKKGLETDYGVRFLTRGETKQLFQIYLNGDSKRTAFINGVRSEINKFIELKYPPIHEIITAIKDNGELLYAKLVKIETDLIMSIVEDLYSNFDDIMVLTCHDAIYVPQSFQEKVSLIWDRYLANFTKGLPKEKKCVGVDYIAAACFEEFDEESATTKTDYFDEEWDDDDEWE